MFSSIIQQIAEILPHSSDLNMEIHVNVHEIFMEIQIDGGEIMGNKVRISLRSWISIWSSHTTLSKSNQAGISV